MNRFLNVVAGMLPLALAAANLLPDGGFEEKTGWHPAGTVRGVKAAEIYSYTPLAAHSGKLGIQINDVWDFARSYPTVTVPAVKDAPGCRFRVWVKTPAGVEKQVFRLGMYLQGHNAQGKTVNLIWREQEYTATAEWKEFVLEQKMLPGTEKIGVFIGATGSDKKLKGSILADDAVLETAEIKPSAAKTAVKAPAKKLIPMLTASPKFDPARIEKTAAGFRLKAGVRSRVGEADPKPDLMFTDVQIPKDGFYSIRMQVLHEKPGSFCRMKINDAPYSRILMRYYTGVWGGGREIGIFSMKKGRNTISFVLPEQGEVTYLAGTYAGPGELPPEVKDFKTDLKPQGRPRLLLTPERAERIRKNLTHPEMQRALTAIRHQAANKVKLKALPGSEVEYQEALQDKLIANAFFAVIRNDRKLAHETAQTMYLYFTQLNGFPGAHHFYNIRDAIYAAAVVYDWCYSEFTPAQRKEMIAAFYRLVIRLEPGWPPFRQSIVNGHGNGGQITIAPLAFAIACYDEDPEPFRVITYRVLKELVPVKAYEYRSPVHPQGSNYGSARLRADVFCAAAYRIACSKDVFDRNIYTTPLYWQMIDLPGKTYFKEGDMWGTRRPQDLGWSLLFAYDATRDPAVKGFYYAYGLDTTVPLFHLLLNDPAVKPVMPKDAVLPWSLCFGPFHGNLIARTGFYNDEAAAYCFGGRKHNGNHAHADAGAFAIYYRGFLADDIGEYASTYGCAYDVDFNKRSIAHNMLRVFDPGESFGKKRDNDGGSRTSIPVVKSPADYEKDPRLDYGTNKSVSIGPDKMRPAYSVMASDLTNAYSQKLKHYMRFFIFLNQQSKEQPASLIVMDLAETAKADLQKIFQVSTWREPVLKKNFIGLSTAEGGRADMNLYLPEQAKITDYAGKNSIKNFLTGHQNEFESIPGGIGRQAHRIEVTPGKAQTFDTFLAHFGIRDGKAAVLPQSYADLGNAHAVRSGKFLVLLPKKDELIAAPVTVTIPAGGLQVLAVYLKPGAWHAGKFNFTVKAGEKTLFLDAPAGKLVIAPGTLAGAPAYQVPAKCTPPEPPPVPRLQLDGKALPGDPVYLNGKVLLPVESIPGLPQITETTTQIRWNGLDIPVAPQKINGKLCIQAELAAGFLHARMVPDFMTECVKLSRLPEDQPAVISAIAPVTPERLYNIVSAGQRSGDDSCWVADRNTSRFTLVFDKAVTLSGMDITYRYGDIRDFPVKIEVSADGKTFHEVFSGMSRHGEKLSEFRWKPQTVRAVRYLGSGTTLGTWTTIDRIGFAK